MSTPGHAGAWVFEDTAEVALSQTSEESLLARGFRLVDGAWVLEDEGDDDGEEVY